MAFVGELRGGTPLTVESFTVAMRDLNERHPKVKTIVEKSFNPLLGKIQLTGETEDRYFFTIQYLLGDEERPEQVMLSMIMRTNSKLSDDALPMMTMRMHRDIPGTETFELYPLLQGQYRSIILGCSVELDESVTVEDMDTLFAGLCKAAPKVNSQFFQGAWVHMRDRKPL